MKLNAIVTDHMTGRRVWNTAGAALLCCLFEPERYSAVIKAGLPILIHPRLTEGDPDQ